jgi:3-methyladenine DNA glycosylase AlkD
MDATGAVLAWLRRRGSRKNVEGLKRYGIQASRAFGVTVGDIKTYGRTLGTNHPLAQELWASGWYEARLLAAFIDDPQQVSRDQMERWADDFDNWAVVDTVCFHLFDRTPHAWSCVRRWASALPEFKKRAAFALLWSLSVHERSVQEDAFLEGLRRVEEAAKDERHFVKKAVDMALRAVGKRSRSLNAAAIETAARLAARPDEASRWIGTHALRELKGAAVRRRLGRLSTPR